MGMSARPRKLNTITLLFLFYDDYTQEKDNRSLHVDFQNCSRHALAFVYRTTFKCQIGQPAYLCLNLLADEV